MLAEVRVRDLALLETVELTLAPGLNVVSGETGEGKSLLLNAITLLLGARSRKGLVRHGAREAVVEGRFVLDAHARARVAAVTDLVAPDADELCLRRVVAEDGQSRSYLDGALCPVGLLQKIGPALVDLHGQGATHALLRPAEQALVLDRFGGTEARAQRYAAAHRALREVVDELRKVAGSVAERHERLEFLRFQEKELAEAEPLQGEEGALDAELRILARAGDLQRVLHAAAAALAEDDGAVGEVCARCARELGDLAGPHPDFAPVIERLRNLGNEAEDLARTCTSLVRDLPADDDRPAAVEARLGLLRALGRRHRCEPDALPARLASLRSDIAELGGDGGRTTELESRKGEILAVLWLEGAALLTERRSAARRLERLVAEGLSELRMERARLRFHVEPADLPQDFDPLSHGENGPGPVRIHVAANPGEPEQPLDAVASGGEMARVMLALKSALAGAHNVPLLIFDEIDAGIGGRVGMPFGRRIAAIARHHQVLIVTHLPQVAAFADRHLKVRKIVSRGRTRTEIEVLEADERIRELAEMLGIEGTGDLARAQAKALLGEAQA